MYDVLRNGVQDKMTPEEIAEMERLAAEMPPPGQTQEEIIAAQGREIEALKEALEMLLSGVVEDG